MIIEYHWSVIRRAFTDATCMVYRTGGGVTGLDTLKGDTVHIAYSARGGTTKNWHYSRFGTKSDITTG